MIIIKYEETLSRASSIIKKDNEEYCIMEFKHDTSKVALYQCDIEAKSQKMKSEGRHFKNLLDPYMGHAGACFNDGNNQKEKWIWKPVGYIYDFDVVFDW